MADSELLYEVKDRIATITLNRPDKMNAFTGPMIERWAASLQEAQRDSNVNVVIVTGAGKAFCSGGDVGRMGSGDPTPLDNKNGLWEHIHNVPRTLEAMDKPVIAIRSGVSWSIVIETRLSRARLLAFWLSSPHRNQSVMPSFTKPTVVACGQPSGRSVAMVMILCAPSSSRIFCLSDSSMRPPHPPMAEARKWCSGQGR